MLGSLISAGAGLLGGILGGNREKKMMRMQLDAQREALQHSVRWRVQDAKKAGIHPVYALGAPTMNISPVGVGDSLGPAIANAGADIGRAVDAYSSRGERAVGKQMQALQLERLGLENNLLRAKIGSEMAIASQAGNPPPAPTMEQRYLVDGQGSTALPNLVTDEPLRRVVSQPGKPHLEPGAVTDIGFVRTRDGYAPVMSSDAKERYEDDFIGGLTWNIRNRLMPTIGVNHNAPPVAPKKGHVWDYDPYRQQYYQRPTTWYESWFD